MNKAQKKDIMERHSRENEYSNERGVKVHLVTEDITIITLAKTYSKWLGKFHRSIDNSSIIL